MIYRAFHRVISIAVVSSLVCIFAVAPLFVMNAAAQQQNEAPNPVKYVTLSPLPQTTDNNCTSGKNCTSDLGTYLPGMFKLIIAVAGGLAVIMIVIGGIQKMSTDSIFEQEEGKKKIKNALGGLLLAISAWLIMYTINPDLLNTSLYVPPVVNTGGNGGAGGPEAPSEPPQVQLSLVIYGTQSGLYRVVCSGPYPDVGSCTNAVSPIMQQYYPPPGFTYIQSVCSETCTPVEPTPDKPVL